MATYPAHVDIHRRQPYPHRPERKGMTIAIGQSCYRGVIIGADTLAMRPDGSTTEEIKTTSFVGKSGIFALANASDNLYATQTMVNSLVQALTSANLTSMR